MGLNYPNMGMYYAAEFQTAALPYVTSTLAPGVGSGVLRIDFEKITKFIQVNNLAPAGQYLRMGFTENGVRGGNHYLINGGDESYAFDLRVKTLFFAGVTGSVEMSLMAGLTCIDARQMPILSGSLSDGSPGWIGVG